VTTGPMTRAVNAALRSASPQSRDGGAVQLAKRYAALIDEAAPAAKYAAALAALRIAVEECSDPDAGKHLEKIEIALAAHSVASDLGPKLLATLTALGMTAAGRGKEGGAPVVPVASKLDEFTARRTGQHAS
jgi:hypothetical protein